MKVNKEDLIFIGIILVVLSIFFYSILGSAGMVSVLAIIILFFVPTYLLLDNFSLGKDEKLVFSFFCWSWCISSYILLVRFIYFF